MTVADNNRRRRQNARKEALMHYSHGAMVCEHCGISDERVLTIDHSDQQGSKHFSEIPKTYKSKLASWLKINKWPEGFRVLCFNCNIIAYHEHTKGNFHA